MNLPHVTCVCPTADRQALTDRAVKCFLAQTYPNKSLLILDNGHVPYHWPVGIAGVSVVRSPLKRTIGEIRNLVNEWAAYSTIGSDADNIIAHWDSDDWSHPLRLAWQVKQLTVEGSDIQVVGYRSLLFWDSRPANNCAWMYEHESERYAVGTSLMYRWKTWKAKPFAERNRPGVPPEKDYAEDHEWIKGLRVLSVPGFFRGEPAMIAEIHGGNLCNNDWRFTNESANWRPAPEWTERVRERMKL